MPPFDPEAVRTTTSSRSAVPAVASLTGTALGSAALSAAEEILGGRPPKARPVVVESGPAADASHPAVRAHRALRRAVFVDEQGLFPGSGDLDGTDADPHAVVLVARDAAGEVLGGVRLGPALLEPSHPVPADLGWWTGSRLAVAPGARRRAGIRVGAALVRAACAHAEAAGVLRFDADVQAGNEALFTHLGWDRVRETVVAGRDHVRMRWPIGRFQALVDATKAPLGALLGALGPAGFVGDDGAPVPGSDVIAACDAILPAMVERDPEWAGWCGVLVNLNDLAAMGARPVGLLDAVGARDASFAHRVLAGLRAAADAYGVPILGGHTQLDVPASLSVTALGHTRAPVPAGGGRVGHEVRLTADLGGGWRPGHTGRQWDSTSTRTRAELAATVSAIGPDADRRPASAKDVSMAGAVGTLGMLAEASGTGAVLDVAAVPRPAGASAADWLTCFPGFAMLTADEPGAAPIAAGPAVSADCGSLEPGAGVRLRWPDGEITTAVTGTVTGMGPAVPDPSAHATGAPR